MKVIIAGSRNLNPSITDIDSALAETGWTIRQVISGTAKGVDRRGEAWDEKSRGTADMIEQMNRLGKPVHIVRMNHARID